MNKFIMTDEIKNVKNQEIQTLLEEVVSCYANGNYRAAVVTLYTTMIYDLLWKINTLSNYYDITQAKELIDEISKQKSKAPKSPQWEDKLLQGVKDINLISNEEFGELENLKTNRNFAAHPIVSLKSDNTIDYFEIKKISRETAADMIRKAFEIVFLRDPVIATNINKKIETDIKNYFYINRTEGLENYVSTKYISKMENKPKEMLFTFLWKMSFIKDDFNYKQAYVTALVALCNSNQRFFADYLKGHPELFYKIETENLSKCQEFAQINVLNFKNNSRLVNLFYFLEKLPIFYDSLNDYIRNILYDESKKEPRNLFIDSKYNLTDLLPRRSLEIEVIEQIKLFAENLYFVENISVHFKKIEELSANVYGQSIFDKEMLSRMYIQAIYFGYTKDLTKELINNIAAASSFAEADNLMNNISILKKYFNQNDCRDLLESISKNDQFTNNRNYTQMKNEIQK
jgi:hypothetical protein|nr:hypothetical protein [uncultured Acetatifactor sp.]